MANSGESSLYGSLAFSRGSSDDARISSTPRIGQLTSRHRFSKSLGDLSHSCNPPSGKSRKSVAFEEDLFEQREVLQRARQRFRELELKYPEIFKDFSRTSSVVAALNAKPSAESDKDKPPRATHEMDTLQVPSERSFSAARNSTNYRRAPRLSVAMRSHNLEDSSDSAFDENLDRELSVQTTRSLTEQRSRAERSLDASESIESDKDSGISTDRPFIPPVLSHRPVRWADDDTTLKLRKAKSLSLQALEGKSASIEGYPRDRRGILKSAAYKNQGILAESLSETPGYSRKEDRPEDQPRRLSKGLWDLSERVQRTDPPDRNVYYLT